MRIGFVPLIDAAPVIAAFELDYFAEEGVSVALESQIGWGNVRDKLTFGQLDASHALLGMPAASLLASPGYPQPLVALLSLGFGGNGITLGRRLFDSGIDSAESLATCIKRQPRDQMPMLMAHVFSCSCHHYLLRDWLTKGGVHPDRDARLCVLPPSQMVRQMRNGYLDVFCVGEPWNTAAEIEGRGKVITLTTDIVPEHPEKVFAVSRQWLSKHPEQAARAVRALIRAGEFCGLRENRGRLIEILAQPQYLDVTPEILARSLDLDSRRTSPTGDFYGISPAGMFPSATHVAWLLGEMKKWNHLPADAEIRSIAAESVASETYRSVAPSLGIQCPQDDFPAMRLRNGWFGIDSITRNNLRPTTVA